MGACASVKIPRDGGFFMIRFPRYGIKKNIFIKILIRSRFLYRFCLIRKCTNPAEIGPLSKSRENNVQPPNIFYLGDVLILYIVSESLIITLSVDFWTRGIQKENRINQGKGKGARYE